MSESDEELKKRFRCIMAHIGWKARLLGADGLLCPFVSLDSALVFMAA
jgi:hypothetical protein